MQLYNGDCLEVMKNIADKSVDLTVTSPPYDNLRTYNGNIEQWNFDKFQQMHLTPAASVKIAAPGIEESPVSIECRVKDRIPLGTHDLFIAEVLSVDVDERYLDAKGRFDMKKADLLAYSHGEYFTLGEKIGKFGYSVAGKKRKSNVK